MGLKQFFETVYQSISGKKDVATNVSVEAGTQRTQLPGFQFLYENPPNFLTLYKQLYDNVPVLDAAIDVYTTLCNPSWKIICDNPNESLFVTEQLKLTNFNDELNSFITSFFLYGFGTQEIVLSDRLDRVLKFVTIPSIDVRIQRDVYANYIKYYQTGVTSRYSLYGRNRAESTSICNPYRRDELDGGKSGTPQVELNPNTIIFMARNQTLDAPYGRSLFQALPFLTRIMLEMQDAYGKLYTKYASPRFHVKYIPAIQLNQNTLNERLGIIKEKFDNLEANQDFFTAGDVDISVVGAGDGQTIHFYSEMQEVMQGIFSGLRLPAGVLGYNYGSTETHLAKQLEILTAKIKSYQVNFQEAINQKYMPLIAQVYNLTTMPKLVLGEPTIVDELQIAQIESARLSNVERKMTLGLIDVTDAQEELELEIKTVALPKVEPEVK